ncbi:hypothetical protein [Companilactobacillus ginsenosidimutans]|uniref:Uncharacterized protein n=1 Tax=Companilactobacillus ginsenosidimutans TaxID=1007676 RepID=A0A0H4QK72_9LACO|nr:hypothetical protein [Companilactobacillus ginsenosidimutans]AKP67436.1 hypothetical protein ABM34_07745 [Companilactobacillus ginsenosidimutans]
MNLNLDKFKNTLKNKNLVTIITAAVVIIVLVIAGRAIRNNHQQQNLLSGNEVSFTGYNGHGSANFDQAITLDTWKKVAQVEGKKAGLKKDRINLIINNAHSYNDLVSDTTSSNDGMKLSDYLSHMSNTRIILSKDSSLANGNKITMTLRDKSTNPYVKTQSKVIKVSDLKESKTVTIDSIMKHIKLSNTGTNGYANEKIIIDKNAPSEILSMEQTFEEAFEIDSSKTYSNGHKFSISQQDLADGLNESVEDTYYKPSSGKKATLTVSGLKDPKRTAKNLSAIDDKIKNDSDESISLWKAYYVDNKYLDSSFSKNLVMIYKIDDTKNVYLILNTPAILKGDTLYQPADDDDEPHGDPIQDDVSFDDLESEDEETFNDDIKNLYGFVFELN